MRTCGPPVLSFIKFLHPLACTRVCLSRRVSPLERACAPIANLLGAPRDHGRPATVDGQPARVSETIWWFCSFEGERTKRRSAFAFSRKSYRSNEEGRTQTILLGLNKASELFFNYLINFYFSLQSASSFCEFHSG